MEEIIIYSEEFHNSIENLIEILFKDEYFGFKSDCHIYAQKIYDFVDLNIQKPIAKTSPLKFCQHGRKFIKYKANHKTFWYIFFDEKDGNFIVNYILNNHSRDFPELL